MAHILEVFSFLRAFSKMNGMKNKKFYSLLLLSLLFIGLSVGGYFFFRQNQSTESFVSNIERYLHEQEDALKKMLNEKDIIDKQLLGFRTSQNSQYEIPDSSLAAWAKSPFTIAIYQEDTLVFWSNTSALPSNNLIPENTFESRQLIELNNGVYAAWARRGKHPVIGQFTWVGVIPIQYHFRLKSDYLIDHFMPRAPFNHTFKVSDTPGDYPIHWKNGQVLTYLEGETSSPSFYQQIIILSFFAIGFFCLSVALTHIGQHLSNRYRSIFGSLFLVGSIIFIKVLISFFIYNNFFDQLGIFEETLPFSFNRSQGEFILNALLLLWGVFYLHGRKIGDKNLDERPFWARVGIAFLNTTSILTALLLIILSTHYLVMQTDVSFIFETAFNLETEGVLIIIGSILLTFAFFLFGHHLILNNYKMNLPLRWHFVIAVVSATLVFFVSLFIDFYIPSYKVFLISLLTLLLFELFIRSTQNVTSFLFLIWLTLLSALLSFLLFTYSKNKDMLTRQHYARSLLPLRDSLAEKNIQELIFKIKNDPEVQKLCTQRDTTPLNRDSLRRKIDQLYKSNAYLFYNYGYNFYAFLESGGKAFEEQKTLLADLILPLDKQTAVSNTVNLLFGFDSKDRPLYRTSTILDISNSFTIFLDFQRQKIEKSQVYTELLQDRPYKNLKHLKNFNYTIYSPKDVIIDQEGSYSWELEDDDLPEPGKIKERARYQQIASIYRDKEGYTAIVSKQSESWDKILSLASFIFALFIVFILILSIINSVIQVLPEPVNLSLAGPPSLRRLFQLIFLVLTAIFFILIGFTTLSFFQESRKVYHDQRLLRKMNSIQKDADFELELLDVERDQKLAGLTRFIPSFSEIHKMDINLYDENGRLVRSSEDDFFDSGLQAPVINPLAFQALAIKRLPRVTFEENIGKLEYRTGYVSLQVKEKGQNYTLGYLGLPYYSKQRQMSNDVNLFMGKILNVYAILVLITATISIYAAGNITRGLSQIEEKLQAFQLGKPNQPLEWKRKDEVGALVNAYNQMIDKLQHSADKLAQSEREFAWREMAKQVAHEIKNPLTPMQLSLQHLIRAYDSNPEAVEPIFRTVTTTLIEQIRNLSQIASEFSNFAKMPQPVNEQVTLNQIVDSVFDLFNEETEVDLYKYVPKENLNTFVDRSLLISVLNNLVKNAIQAIPDDRRGNIGIHLFERDAMAVIMVEDNGSGIPEDKQEKVFVPNFTTKNSGTGLGLAIARNVVKAANGKIYFETVINKGTRFFVELPLVNKGK